MPVQCIVTLEDLKVPVKIWTKDFDINALGQLQNVASLPFVFKHVAAMPDVHAGIGATIGSVVATQGAICPSIVGSDIGCGVLSQQTTLRREDLPEDLGPLRTAIEEEVPHGLETVGRGVKGAWGVTPGYVPNAWFQHLEPGYRVLEIPTQDKCPSRQLGTLGGGNHFIELCFDEEGFMWILIHSGSRGVGNAIGKYYIDLAKQEAKKWFIDLLDPDLAYFPEGTQLFNDYLEAVDWAQKYAEWNRKLMLRAVLNVLGNPETKQLIDCCHNYVAKENHFGQNVWITRKGAILARERVLGVIPGSMGQRSYIVKGKGNRDSFNSCSHGAGRSCGRKQAERLYTLADLAAQTEGVECRKDLSVLDEIPSAYKDLDTVMENQSDLCTVVHTLKAVLTVKG